MVTHTSLWIHGIPKKFPTAPATAGAQDPQVINRLKQPGRGGMTGYPQYPQELLTLRILRNSVPPNNNYAQAPLETIRHEEHKKPSTDTGTPFLGLQPSRCSDAPDRAKLSQSMVVIRLHIRTGIPAVPARILAEVPPITTHVELKTHSVVLRSTLRKAAPFSEVQS